MGTQTQKRVGKATVENGHYGPWKRRNSEALKVIRSDHGVMRAENGHTKGTTFCKDEKAFLFDHFVTKLKENFFILTTRLLQVSSRLM
jgi:hypothetical protein